MATEWYFAKDDEQHGPYSAADLKSLAQSGELTAKDLVWKDGMAEWKPASTIKELFPPTRPTPPVQASPPPPPKAPKVGPARSASQESIASEWYYSKAGEQHGPMTASELNELAKSGELSPADLVWKEGMSEWKPAHSINGLLTATKTPPPPPSSSSPQASPAETIMLEAKRWFRDPILIAVLSLLLPPLGQFIIGQRIKAVVILLMAPVIHGVLSTIDWYFLHGSGWYFRWFLLPPAYCVLVAADAYLLAKRIQDGGTVGEWEFAMIPSSSAVANESKPAKVVEPKPAGLIPSLVAMTIVTSMAFLWGVYGFFSLGPSGMRDLTGFFVCISIGYNALVAAMLWLTKAQKNHPMIVIANRMVFANWVPFLFTRVPLGITMMGCILSIAAAAWGHFVIQRGDVKDYFDRKESA